MKKCTKCLKEKEISDFSKCGKLLRSSCKECIKKYNKLYFKNRHLLPKERLDSIILSRRAATKKWSLNNKEYLSEYRSKFHKPLRKRFLLLKKYNYTCQYCGAKAPDIELEVDHILPKSKGGSDKEENLTISCVNCNLGKGDILL